MTRSSVERAVEEARNAAGVDPSVPAQAWEVYPPHGEEPSYVLVLLGDPARSVGVAAVDARSEQVLSSAALPGTGPHLGIGAPEAVEKAGLLGARARLVWRASRASRSPLYPLWEVRGGGRTLYVDQQGGIWPDLTEEGRGGGA